MLISFEKLVSFKKKITRKFYCASLTLNEDFIGVGSYFVFILL